MKKNLLFIALAMTVIVFFTNCGGKGKHGSKNGSVEQNALFAYPLPTSFDITEMLNSAGASYIISVTNDVANVDRYVTIRTKALNLGVYSADLCYSSSYNMKQELLNSLNATKTLMEQLDINTPFTQKLVENLEKNGDNKDSSLVIISETIKDIYNHLKSNEKEEISLLVMSGSYIEGLFIAAQMASLSPNNTDLMKVIASQKVTLVSLLKLIEPFKDKEDIKTTYEDLKKLENFYANVVTSISEEQLYEVSRLTESIRNKIVE